MANPDIRLVPDELVDDRALDSASGDEFRHSDFADELTDLVCEVPTPSNVALFAPWGSGKTGLGNMLGAGLKDREGVRFARFDAFKYAEAPLRRHFISQVAKSLGRKEEHFSDDLYRQLEKREVSFSKEQQVKLVRAFLQTLLLVGLVLVVIAGLVAAANSVVHGTTFSKEWSSALKGYLLVTVPVAAIVTAFVKLSGEGLIVNSTRSAPSGEEEFERVFRQLVDKVGAKRLVIFIDELDRCSSEQVVSALETIKTFLEVPGCIFVVAADLQVLEQALRKEARQETPHDATNPYYSAGSSYLDKVFQYQIALPPLKPRRLTTFALSLVRERPGVWQRVENLAEVISVLIPTHVKSPRRVKVLLNSFALTYRLAERRAQEGVLAENLPARANEVAKLVCLRCEFPLFAEDLVLDQRLPELVQVLADGEELPPNVSPEVESKARDYARGRLPVGSLLVDERRHSNSSASKTQLRSHRQLRLPRRSRRPPLPRPPLPHRPRHPKRPLRRRTWNPKRRSLSRRATRAFNGSTPCNSFATSARSDASRAPEPTSSTWRAPALRWTWSQRLRMTLSARPSTATSGRS